MTKTLSKELVEAEIAQRHVGARAFDWETNSLTFEYDTEMPRGADMIDMSRIIASLQSTISRQDGALDQASSTINKLITTIVLGGIR